MADGSTSSNWSLGAPPVYSDSIDYITNATSKTVTIDAATPTNSPNTMRINSLVLSAPSGSTNTLLLNNAA